MKQSKSFLTRFLALALALVLIASNANLGLALKVFADEGKTTVEAGKVVASNYELSEAEENLLNSGYLVGEVEYAKFNGTGLVAVSGKKITAATYEEWTPVTAYVVVDDEVKETIDLTETDSFTGDYEAFSVVVEYVLNKKVDEQAQLLAAAADLKAALAGVAAANECDLSVVAMAMDTLSELADGKKVSSPFGETTVQFGADAIAAVEYLEEQLADDTMDMQDWNAKYVVAASKIQHLVVNAAAHKAAVADTYKALLAINNDQEVINNQLLNEVMVDNAAWNSFKSALADLVSEMEAVNAAVWNVAAVDTDLADADYVALDKLVNEIKATTSVAAKEYLKVAEDEARFDQSMYTVTIKVVLKTVAGSVEKTDKVTAKENADKATVQAKVDAKVAAILADLSDYEEEHYVATATELPDTLTADAEYTVTYTPKNYKVTYDAGYIGDAAKTEELPYGTKIVLEKAGEGKAYDYTVNGASYEEGATYTVVGDTTITRVSGKAYTKTDLYSIIADNYGNDVVKAILKSGSVANGVKNVAVNVRKPDPADAESLLLLKDGYLEAAATYPSSYNGYNWAPYQYTNEEGKWVDFDGAVKVANDADYSDVTYILELNKVSAADVASVLAMATELKGQTAGQVEMLNKLVGYKEDMSTLSGGLLSMLNGLIADTAFVDDADLNAEIQAHFLKYTAEIKAKCMTNNQLRLYPLVEQYASATGGLRYYYENSAAFLTELGLLSGVLTEMLPDETYVGYMTKLVESFENDPFLVQYAPYAEKIPGLKDGIVEINEKLTAPDSRIVMGENLGKLIAAVQADGEAKVSENVGHPYIVSEELRAMNESQIMVQVVVTVGDVVKTFKTLPFDKIAAVDGNAISALDAEVKAYIAEVLGENREFYKETQDGNIFDYVGKTLDKTLTVNYTCTPVEYTVKIGDKVQTIDITDLEIELPKHPNSKYVYKYTIGDTKYGYGNYTFTVAQLKSLFVDNSYTIAVEEIDEANQKLEGAFGGTTEGDGNYYEFVKNDKNEVVGINAYVNGDQAGLMEFAERMAKSGFGYIGLNGEPLLYEANVDGVDVVEVSVQTLVNAMLNDASFGSEKLIQLGADGKGELLTASMQLGSTAEDLYYDGDELTFKMILKSAPSKLAKVSNGLNAVKNYMSFKSNKGELAIELNLPEKLYEVYLTALLAAGELKINDINAINTKIAFMFFYDYLEIIMTSDATAQSFQNTLNMLYNVADNVVDEDKLPQIDLAKYEPYYQLVKKAFNCTDVKTNADAEKQIFTVTATDSGLNEVLDLFGLGAYLDMVSFVSIKELNPGENLTVVAKANLRNTNEDLEAAIFDLDALKAGVKDLANDVNKNKLVDLVKGKGAANGIDFTYDLIDRLATVSGNSIVVLLGDVEGDLYFKAGSILDLNGYTVDGNITADGKLIIVDSTPATFECGTVTGSVSGAVCALAGKFPAQDVSAFLKDGYYQNENAIVQNALYWIEQDGIDLTIVLNSDYMYDECVEGYLPSMRALAADIAADLATKYFAPAALQIDGYTIYDINFDKLIALLNSSDKIDDVLAKVVDCFSAEDLKGFANALLDDLTDFDGIYNAMKNDKVIGDYLLTTTPWAVGLEYVAESDHIDVSIGASDDAALNMNVNIGLKIVGTNKDKFLELVCELRDILSVDADLDIKKPVYDGTNNTLYLAGSASTTVTADLFASCTYSNEDYITIFTVLFANAGAENSAAMVEALNKGDMEAVKDAFDEMTVEDVFTAMKELDRPDDFAKLAADAGVTVDVAAADRLESLYHLIIVAVGKSLEAVENGTVNNAADKVIDKVGAAADSEHVDNVIDKVVDKVGSNALENATDKVNSAVTSDRIENAANKISNRIDAFLKNYAVSNLDKKLGNLDKDDDGTYELTLTASRRADATRRGYTVDLDVQEVTLELKVIIFEPINCLWGDANHDGSVDGMDATLIACYAISMPDIDICTLRTDVNCDGAIDGLDATLVARYAIDLEEVLPVVSE